MRMVLVSLFLMLGFFPRLSAGEIIPEDAKNHIGEITSVRGAVVEVYVSKRHNVYLNFGAPYPNQTFSADVLNRRSGTMLSEGGQWLKDLQGKTVVVTGKIEIYKGKPEIVLLEREDLHIPSS